jgi:hypothetical protein
MHIGFWWESQKNREPLGGPIRRWDDNIKTDIREIWVSMDWIHLAQDTDQWRDPVNMVINFF